MPPTDEPHQPLQFKQNPWILFLRKYGPIPRNDNMYDESIQRSLRRTHTSPVAFQAPYLPELLANFQGTAPRSTILTGTAGDGKTFLCRKIWEGLGGDAETWDGSEKVREVMLPSGKKLVVIKDLSELREEDRAILVEMSEAVCDAAKPRVFLIAANDGQLVEAFNQLPAGAATDRARHAIEELLVSNRTELSDIVLRLYNLSRTSAAQLLDSIVEAVINHPGWQGCQGCRGQLPERENRCPIWENYQRLQAPLFRQRLHELLELCDRNEYHLPIRQLLLLISNIVLGHQDAKDFLLRCVDVPEIVQSQRTELASPYRNAFGMNLSEGRRDGIEVFDVLGRFGIGEETSNRIDNMLIFGSDDETLKPLFDAVVRSDPLYGVTPRYLTLQSAYLDGSDEAALEEFLRALAAQRQRLFFTLPAEHINTLRLWDLTVFHYAGEYLDEVVGQLRAQHAPPRHVIARLVRGMNRVFSGMLTTTDRLLVLATSGSYSQARVSRIEEAMLSVEPRRGERTTLEPIDGRVVFSVYLDRDTPPVRLPLHLVRYEFLSRVAEGALPSSFSKECYEDLLAFKSKLLREYRRVVDAYGESPPEDQLHLKLLQLDTRGAVTSRPLEVRLT